MSTTTNAFHISGGQIIGPNGQPFVVQGMALLDSMMSQVPASLILSKFPTQLRSRTRPSSHG